MACPLAKGGKRNAEQSLPIPWVLSRTSGALGSAMLGVPLCLHSFFPWLAAETCPQPSANVHGFGGVLIRASCAGVDGLHMREVQSRQLSHAFTLYAMGRTSSRTGFNFTDTNRFGKGRARDDYAHPLSLKPYSHLAPKDLILS